MVIHTHDTILYYIYMHIIIDSGPEAAVRHNKWGCT